jgi:hypothetical protein
VSLDTDLQVWLETLAQTSPALIVPYVQSETARTLQFRWEAVRQGPQGTSRVRQRGTLMLQAGLPAALGRLQMTGSGDDVCRLEIELSESGRAPRHYQFPCSS